MTVHKGRIGVTLFVLALGLLLLLFPAVCFTVDERELAVVLQFGNPVRECREAGLYFKMPFVQEARKLPKTRQLWGGQAGDALPDLPTADSKKISVVPWAVWRITDPTAFVTGLRDVDFAKGQVAVFVRSAMRDVITQYDLSELVRSTDRELTHSFGADARALGMSVDHLAGQTPEPTKITLGREKILAQIKDEARKNLANEGAGATGGGKGERGIEIIDIGIAKIDFVPIVRQAAFDRQKAFRQSIASLYTNEGERLKQEILNSTNAEVQKIEGKGKQEANELRGKVDAEIIQSYAKATEEAGEFYTFLRTLEAYKKVLGSDTRIILTTDSDFFRLLKQVDAKPSDGLSVPKR